MIRLLQPRVPTVDAALGYLRRIDEAKHYSNFGPLVRELEERLSQHYAGAYVVTCSSCTAGLELVYTLKMIQGYRKIELPALTFPATWLAANRSGLQIKPIDVDPETWIAPGVSGFGLRVVGHHDLSAALTALFLEYPVDLRVLFFILDLSTAFLQAHLGVALQ